MPEVSGGGYGRVFACGEDISPFTTPRERASVKKACMCTGIPLRVAHGTEFKSKAYTSKEKTKDTTWVSWRLRPGIHLWRRYPLPTPEKRAFLSSVGGCEPDSLCFARRKVDTKCDLRHQKNKGHSLRVSFVFWRCRPDLNRRITVLQTGALPLGYCTKIPITLTLYQSFFALSIGKIYFIKKIRMKNP